MTAQAMAKGPGGSTTNAPGGATCYWKEMWKKLNMMRQFRHLCDVEIFSSDGQMFMAHSAVLAASSEVFHAFLVHKDTSIITEKGERQLYLSKVPADILQITVDFIYGNMPTTMDAFEKLERGAALLRIEGAMSFIGHKGTATKPGSKCPMSQWKNKQSTAFDDDIFNIDHVLFSIPPASDHMFDPSVNSSSNEPVSQPSADDSQLSSVTREALNVVMQYEDGQTAGSDDVARQPCIANSLSKISTNTAARPTDDADNDKGDEDEEPRCPFAKSLGIFTKGMENPHDLLTDISLADTYPETTDTCIPPPKKDKQRISEILENELAETTIKPSELNELESMDESEFVPLIATKRKKSRSKKGGLTKSIKLVEDENSNEILDDKQESSDGGSDEWLDETSQQSDATSGQDESQDSKMIKLALQKVIVDKKAEESNQKLVEQLASMDDDRMYTCLAEGCNYKNKMLDYLQSHMFHRHNLGQPDKQCPNCYHAYFSFRQLKTHLRRTHFKADDKSEAGHFCGECGLLFKQITSLKLHQLKVHGKGKVFSCEDCEFKSPRKKDMQYHMLSRHNKKPPGVRIFECLYCNYKCVDKSRHEEHQAKHTAEQKYSCHLCGKAYTTKRGMRTHLKYHSDARPHQCPYCPASFKMKNKLNAHIKLLHTHNEVRPFQCGYCNHLTKSRGNCNQHIRKHHKGMPVVVIDHLASIRRPGPGYHYTNIKGQGVIETKDLSMAKWASVGHSENRGYVRHKPESKNGGSDATVNDPNKYDSDSSAVDFTESSRDGDSCKLTNAQMSNEIKWAGHDVNGGISVKTESTTPDVYNNKLYMDHQENMSHTPFYKQSAPGSDGFNPSQNYASEAVSNDVDMTCPFAGTSPGFSNECQPLPGVASSLHRGGPAFGSGCREMSNSGLEQAPYNYTPFGTMQNPNNQASQLREAIFL